MGTLTGTKLSACVVLYNPTDEALETIRCLAEATAGPDLFVVDNGRDMSLRERITKAFGKAFGRKEREKQDESATVTAIRKGWPQVTVLQPGRNLGYGEGNNLMLDHIRRDYHLICNPDVTFDKNLLTDMIRWMDAHPDVGLLSPRVLNPDGTEQFLPRRSPTVRYLMGSLKAMRGDKLLRRAEILAEEGRHHRVCEAWWRHRGFLPREEKEEQPAPRPADSTPFDPETHVKGTVIDSLDTGRIRRGNMQEKPSEPLRDSLVHPQRGEQLSPEEQQELAMERHRREGLFGLLAKRPTLTLLIAQLMEKRGHALKRVRAHYTMEDDPPREPIEVEFATGCFMLIRSKLFYRLGGFDHRFFLYHEDSDLSLRAREAGKVVYHPGFTITHAWHRASGHSFHARLRHLVSTVRFFHKWGWAW